MATYTNVAGYLECAGTDITSAGIAAAIVADPSLGTAVSSTAGDRDTYAFSLTLGIRITAGSIWSTQNEFVSVTAAQYFHLLGELRIGTFGTSSSAGGSFSYTSTASSFERFRIYDGGELNAYGALIYVKPSIRADSNAVFNAVDCDLVINDGINTPNGSAGQTVNLSRSRQHNATVGVKLQTGTAGATGAQYTLENTRIEGCTYALQISGDYDPVLPDLSIDNNTLHSIANVGTGSNTRFINPDFTVYRTHGSAAVDDLCSIEFRYALTIKDSAGAAISGVTTRITDATGSHRFDTTTDGSGNPTTFPLATLQNSTYAGITRTERADHSLVIRKYEYNFVELARSATADNLGDVVPMAANANIVQSAATALAHAGITLAIEASPVTWNGKQFTGTVTGDLTTNPSLTITDIYHYIRYHTSLSSVIDGRSGLDWSEMLSVGHETAYTPAGSRFYGGTAVGFRVVDESGNSFVGVTRHQSDDGSYYVVPLTDDLTISSSEAGSTIRVFAAGTQTLIDSAVGSQLIYTHSGETVDVRVCKAGFIFGEQLGVVLSGDVNLSFTLKADPVYVSGHGLTYTTDLSYARATKLLTLNSSANGDLVYSALVDAFVNETSLYNTNFPLQANGSGAFYFLDSSEFADVSSLRNFKRGGITYLNSSSVETARWASIFTLSSVPAGAQFRYQQVAGSGTTNAINTGAINEPIQIYGDVDHGDFTLGTHLVVKAQENGYKQVRVDVIDLYQLSTIRAVAYPIATGFAALSVATGDPAISITIVDHTAAPLVVGGKSFDYEIQGGANSGSDILREINYSLSTGAAFQGKDGFNWPDLVGELGDSFDTVRGIVEDETGLHGVYVSGASGDHPDFVRFQSNDGSYYTPAVTANVFISNVVAGSRLRIFNETTATEIYNDVVAGVSYADSYIDGTDYSAGDVVSVRLTEQSGQTAHLPFSSVTVASSAGWSVIASQEVDAVYNAYANDGSTATKFTADYVDDEIDVSVASNFTAVELYSWFVYTQTTAQGIREFFGGVTAADIANIRFNSSVSLYLDNTTTTNLYQTDNIRIYREDGARPVKNPTTGGGGIDVNWREKVYIAETGVSGLTAGESAQLFSTALESTAQLILGDTSELQANQSNWTTATGFATPANIVVSQLEIQSDIQALNNISVSDVQAITPTAAQNADKLLGRNISGGSDGGRIVTEALRANRNRVDMESGIVYLEDDTTISHTYSVTRKELNAISEVNPD